MKKVTYYLSIQSLYNSKSKKLNKPINKPRFFKKKMDTIKVVLFAQICRKPSLQETNYNYA